MAGYFLDSSALAKLYHTEVGSAAVENLVLHSGATILVSRLSVVELQSVFAGKVRAGVISAGEAAVLRHRFLEDIAEGVFRVVALAGDHYQEAGELIARHGTSLGLRARFAPTRRRVERVPRRGCRKPCGCRQTSLQGGGGRRDAGHRSAVAAQFNPDLRRSRQQ